MPSRDMNMWNATGRIGTDPQMRFTTAGHAVTEFRFAAGRVWKDAQGERRETTTWITIVCWGGLAELANTHMAKGERIGITGRLDLQEWEDRESGEKRSKHVVTAHDVYFLEGRRDQSGEAAPGKVMELSGDEVPF